MTKASPTRAAKKVAAKADPREVAKAAQEAKKAEEPKEAPQLTPQQAVYLWRVLRNNPIPTTGNDRDMLAACEQTLSDIGVAAGLLTRDPRGQ